MTKNWIIAGLILCVLTGVWFWGYYTCKNRNPLPEAISDTVYIHDTIKHTITDRVPYYITRLDSVIIRDTVFREIDTAAILEDYFAVHYYLRTWQDSLIKVSIEDAVTENNFISNNFTYQFLRPQTLINNVTNITNFNKYLYIGGSVTLPDAKYSNVGVYGAFSRSFFGLSYMPYQKGVMFTGGFRIVKMK